ncbi:MAG: methyltransferase domain-containing protein [Candidatus Promineifilaceae bacterium]
MTGVDRNNRDSVQRNLQDAGFLGRSWYRLLRFGFRLLYNEMAWTYDLVSWLVSLGHWREWQLTAIPYLTGRRILEVAHGPGHLLIELRCRGYDVFGLDLSAHMGRQARRNLLRSKMSVPLVRGDVRALPYADESIDSVLSTFPAEFIVNSSAIRELNRILLPGGRIVIVPEARLKDGGLLRRFIGWLFAITGQRVEPAEDGWLAQIWAEAEGRFLEVGLATTIEKVELEDSEVMVVVLNKLLL